MGDELTYDATSRTIDAEGLTIHYHEAGEGPPLVLLHGSGPGVSGWANFGGNLPTFAPRFRTLIMDLPGFGATTAPPYDRIYPRVAADVVRLFLDAVGVGAAAVLGNSMGGNIAAHMALEHPDRVERLVLMAPGGLGVNVLGPELSEGLSRAVEYMMGPSREAMAAWLRSMVVDPALVTDELVDERVERASRPEVAQGVAALSQTFRDPAMREATPLWARGGEIRHPTLILWGRDDRVLPVEMALLPTRQLPDVELHIFPNCGHWAQIEAKERFERVVVEFLTR